MRSVCLQLSGGRIWYVMHFPGGLPDQFRSFRCYITVMIQGLADCGNRNAAFEGYIFDRDISFSASHLMPFPGCSSVFQLA